MIDGIRDAGRYARKQHLDGMLKAMTPKLLMLTLRFLAIVGVASPCAAQPRHAPRLLPPVNPACISSPFGPRVLPSQPLAGTYHYGIDLPAPDGSPVVAAASGTVIRVQNTGPGGLEILIQHDGFVGIYSHFDVIMPEFVAGKRAVAAGEQLGMVGNTGISTGAHLYFEMISGGAPVDPAPYLGVRECDGAPHMAPPAKPATITAILGTETKTIGARTYYQILPPAGQ